MKFTLSTLPFIDKEISDTLLESIKNNGIADLELFGQKPHFDITNKNHMDIIRRAESIFGIRFNSLHLPIYFNRVSEVRDRKQINICSLNNNIRNNSLREVIRHIEVASEFSIPIVVLHTGIDKNDEQEINYLIESLYLLNEIATKYGVLLSLENHTTRAVTVSILISLIQKIDSNNIGICLDVGHSNIFSNYISDLNESRRYLFSLHLHDNNGDADEHLFPYEGNIDFDYIIGFLRKSKFQGVITLELSGAEILSDEDLDVFLKKASKFLRVFENPRLTYNNILEPT